MTRDSSLPGDPPDDEPEPDPSGRLSTTSPGLLVGLALARLVADRGGSVVSVGTSAGTVSAPGGLDVAALGEAWVTSGEGLVKSLGLEPQPAWAVFGADADILFIGSKTGTLTHDGAAHVFQRRDDGWSEIAVLRTCAPEAGRFGSRVADTSKSSAVRYSSQRATHSWSATSSGPSGPTWNSHWPTITSALMPLMDRPAARQLSRCSISGSLGAMRPSASPRIR